MLGPTRLIRDDITDPMVDDYAFHPLYHTHTHSMSSRRTSSQGACSSQYSPSTASEPEFTSITSSSHSSPVASPGLRHSLDDTRYFADSLPAASVQIMRCLRCARTVEATSTDDAGSMGMVRIAHNLHYCERCAKMVGYGK